MIVARRLLIVAVCLLLLMCALIGPSQRAEPAVATTRVASIEPVTIASVERLRPSVEHLRPPVSAIAPDYDHLTRHMIDRRFARVDAAVMVADLDGRMLYARRADRRRTLASLTKLYTAAAAARRWGSAAGESLRAMLPLSDNARAETIARDVGDGQWSRGVRRIQRTGRDLGGRPTLHDGSGLDPRNRDSAYGVVRFLLTERHALGFSTLASALPTAGISGTLRHRLSGLAGRCSAKTGTLPSRGVSTLAGYCDAAKPFAFAILVQDRSVTLSHRMQDEALWLLAERQGVSVG